MSLEIKHAYEISLTGYKSAGSDGIDNWQNGVNQWRYVIGQGDHF